MRNLLTAICLLTAVGFWGAATWIVYQGHSPQAGAGAVFMLVGGAAVALVYAIGVDE